MGNMARVYSIVVVIAHVVFYSLCVAVTFVTVLAIVF